MKTFLGIINKKATVDAKLQARIKLTASRSLSFAPNTYQYEVWQSPSKKMALYNFTNEPYENYGPNLWSREKKAFTASGYFNAPLQVVSNKILNQSRSGEERKKAICSIGGLYAACFADGETDTITVWNTITRIIPVYWVENRDYLVVATRALFAHLLAEGRKLPEYNIMNLGYFLNNGYYNCEYTPYQNVKVLAPNTQLTLSLQGVYINPLDETDIQFENPDAAFFDKLSNTLLESFQPVKKHSVKISLGITGGKDSRLMAALLKSADIDFETSTSGFPDEPEVLVGQMVAKALRIPHKVEIPVLQESDEEQYLTYDILARTRDCLFITDGMLSAYENTNRNKRFHSNKVRLGGHGGELLRGGFAKNMRNCDPNRVKEYFENRFLRYAFFYQFEPLKLYRQDLFDWLDSQPDWMKLYDFGAAYYLNYRCGRWSVAGVSALSTGHHFYAPFFEAKLIKMIQPLPSLYIVNEELVYNLMKRLAPELVDIPFYKQRWGFEAKKPLQGEEEEWRKRAPLLSNNFKAGFDWRRTCLTDMREAFLEQIFHTSSSTKLFQIIKRDVVQQLFNNQLGAFNHTDLCPFLWHLYSAAVLLSNAWLNETGASRIVSIKVPKDPTTL